MILDILKDHGREILFWMFVLTIVLTWIAVLWETITGKASEEILWNLGKKVKKKLTKRDKIARIIGLANQMNIKIITEEKKDERRDKKVLPRKS